MALTEQEIPELFTSLPHHLRSRVLNIWRKNRLFPAFVQSYTPKIRSKFANLSDPEDVADVIAELETADRLLQCDGFAVEYEPFGNAGVDFRVKTENTTFHVETKRIREHAATTLYDKSLARIINAARKVQAPVGVFIEFDGADSGPSLANDLDTVIDEVAREAVGIVTSLSSQLQTGESRRVPLTTFSRLHLTVSHIPDKFHDTPTANFGAVSPILYTQKEKRKFSDRILDAIKQFVPGSPNILVLCCNSRTHEPEELRCAIQELKQSIQDREEELFKKHGFTGSCDVHVKLRLMTAAIVLSCFRPVLEPEKDNKAWIHPIPETSIPEETLKKLTEPKSGLKEVAP